MDGLCMRREVVTLGRVTPERRGNREGGLRMGELTETKGIRPESISFGEMERRGEEELDGNGRRETGDGRWERRMV
jgi:hypothetical protein